ncbi:DUF2066 domain-containing protein [Pararhodospirillum oryzae]|uniref:DUF2066 domain-containing protein n=1 Tax=Pararhodospirillum oryzae TaxID=478448 RepID=A0A512H3G0_9PROT|nr:DUF2066 domain-containing protein [Pararhodospirillum oryzae]GEO79999.1 hypothetical protein ROR02_01300 [Pararhodospirillum oryzae]
MVLGLAVTGLPGAVQARDAYTAPPVEVDVSGASPVQARQKAIDEGQVKALRALLQSLVSPADQGRLPSVDAAKADSMVVDFSLANERTTAKRYLATLTARFNAARVDQLLASAGLGHASGREAPVLVLPVYQESPSSQPLLWEETNPWAAAWNRVGTLREGLVPVVLALGDIEDVAVIDGPKALAGDTTAAGRLASRNGAPDALIVTVTGTPQTGLTVTPRAAGVFAGLKPFTVPADPKAFDQAVTKMRAALDDGWKALSAGPASASSAGAGAGASATPGIAAFGAPSGMPTASLAPQVTPAPEAAAGLGGWQVGAAPAPGDPASGMGAPAPATGPVGLTGAASAPSPAVASPASGAGTPAVVLVRYQSLAQWVDIRRRLQGLPGVGALSLQAVTRDQAQILLPWSGSMDELQRLLQSRGLNLSRSGALWTLEAMANVPATGVPLMGGATPLAR